MINHHSNRTKTLHRWAIVSQPSKCLNFITFREGCFVIRDWMQVLNWSSWDFLSPSILQKMKEDNISQLGDYDAPFCEQYTRGSCYISLFTFKSFDQFNTTLTASNFRHLLSCGTIVEIFLKSSMKTVQEHLIIGTILYMFKYLSSTHLTACNLSLSVRMFQGNVNKIRSRP